MEPLKNFKKNIFVRIKLFYSLFIILTCSSGCATSFLWQQKGERTEKHNGTTKGIQIYTKHSQKINRELYPEIYIHYSEGKKLNKKSWWPPSESGYIVIPKPFSRRSLQLLAELESFLNNKNHQNIRGIKAIVEYRDDIPFSYNYYSFRLIFVLDSEKTSNQINQTEVDDISWTSIHGRTENLKIITISELGSASKFFQDEPKNLEYLQFNKLSGEYRENSLNFVESINLSDFEPILPNTNIPSAIEFTSNKVENVYRHSLLNRCALTLPSVAIDIITLPFQLIFNYLFEHSGCLH